MLTLYSEKPNSVREAGLEVPGMSNETGMP